MEEEQIFLFVAYLLDEIDCYIEKITGVEVRNNSLTILRTSMQKMARDGEKFARVPVEFDPLNNQQCYVVIMTVSIKDRRVYLKSQPKFPAITLSLSEAEEEVKKIQSNPKEYCKNNEVFEKVEILPTLITIT